MTHWMEYSLWLGLSAVIAAIPIACVAIVFWHSAKAVGL